MVTTETNYQNTSQGIDVYTVLSTRLWRSISWLTIILSLLPVLSIVKRENPLKRGE